MRWFWKFVHNVIFHPLLELPFGWGVPMHDWTAQKAFGNLYYIWWLDQNELELTCQDLYGVPERVAKELKSAQGRAGRGRLWTDAVDAPETMDGSSSLMVVPWPMTAMAKHCDNCAGIVIEAEDVRKVRGFPGVITNFKLERIGE